MAKPYAFVLAPLFLTSVLATSSGQTSGNAETVVVHNGSVTLHAMLWRPQGRGPFPAILLNHGSGRSREQLQRLGPYERNAEILGPVFARHGYVFLYLFRHGVGPSSDQGANAFVLMNRESDTNGQEARNALQLQLLENRDMDDALSGLKFLRALLYVDSRNIALVGHSFGGSLTVLLAEREPNLRAVVVFSGAGYSFDRSAALQARLLTAIDRIAAPVFFIHAENDYSLSSGKVLDARREQIGKPHRLKIYPPIGKTVDDGHDFIHLGVKIWEADVFAFLDENMRKAITAAGNILWERARKYANAIASAPGGEPMRSVISRLARLERLNRLNTAPHRFRVQYGFLMTLPDDYRGPRHVVTVRQLPAGPGGEDWFEWEERPGPEPVPNAAGPNDEVLVQVHYVEGKPKA